METVYEGPWEEVAAHGPELAGRWVRLTVEEWPDAAAIGERLVRLRRGLALLAEIGRDKDPYPDREITLDVRYFDEDEPRR